MLTPFKEQSVERNKYKEMSRKKLKFQNTYKQCFIRAPKPRLLENIKEYCLKEIRKSF